MMFMTSYRLNSLVMIADERKPISFPRWCKEMISKKKEAHGLHLFSDLDKFINKLFILDFV